MNINFIINMLDGFGITQRKILAGLLKNREGMTIDDFVQKIEISRTAINQHINALEKDGYLKKHTQTKTRGRPGQIYVLTKKGINLFPKQYAWFSDLLLRNLKEQLGSEGLENVLQDLGERVAERYADRFTEKNVVESVAEIGAIMQDIGYETSVYTEDEHEIRACNCVYHDLASENPEVCVFDLTLISAMSGRKVEHLECMVRGGRECRFRFTAKLSAGKNSAFVKIKY